MIESSQSARKVVAGLGAVIALLLFGWVGAGCGKPCPTSGEAEPTKRFLAEKRPRYLQAMARARQWLDQHQADPLELRSEGFKGKKKMVEMLDAYVRLYSVASASEKPSILNRIKEVVKVTYDPRYHDMSTADDQQFKQDATSYLRAAYLMERLGLDIADYRKQILAIKPRLDAHLPLRGPNQLMAFHWYYSHFQMAEPFPLADAYNKGVIKSRLDPYLYSDNDVYMLTHEIFVPYEYGDKRNTDFFSADDRKYLRWVLERQLVYRLMQKDADPAAELLSCMSYLGFTDSAVYLEALEFILQSQRPDGSWGNYERQKAQLGEVVVDQQFYLHTTDVAIGALTAAFQP